MRFSQRYKVLVLFAENSLFQSTKNILESQGFDVLDTYEEGMADVILLDSFFYSSGAPDYLWEKEPVAPVIHIVSARDRRSAFFSFVKVDEALALPRLNFSGSVEESITAVLEQCENLNLLRRKEIIEFGSGLWTSVMRQFFEPSGKCLKLLSAIAS